jgi:hypothetical protein
VNRQAPVIDRILALGEKASSYTEAGLARKVGASRERIRQLRAVLPHKPVNTKQASVTDYNRRVERQFYNAMLRGIDMLVALVDVRGDDECWPWLGHKSRGYGFYCSKRYVHREVYEREHGPIPKGMLVIHKLPGLPCCNPRHLKLATGRERTWRSFRDGTRTDVSDELRMLAPAKVRAIRRAYAKLPKMKSHRLGRPVERAHRGCAKALARRFGMKNTGLFVDVANGKSGSWILSGKP